MKYFWKVSRLIRMFVGGIMLAWVLKVLVIYLHLGKLALPVQIHSADWARDALDTSVGDYYYYIYMPLHMRLTSYLMGALVALLVHHKDEVAPRWASFKAWKLVVVLVAASIALIARISSHSVRKMINIMHFSFPSFFLTMLSV